MRYREYRYAGAVAQVACFDSGRKEAYAYISPTETGQCATQIGSMIEASGRLAADLGLSPVFHRWHLSDPANQSEFLPESPQCATSTIGQSPLDGTKAAMLLIMEQDTDMENLGDGLWIDQRGRLYAGDDSSVASGSSLFMTRRYLEKLSEVLRSLGVTLKDNCLRTWFFVRDIDVNYSGVVDGRNEIFEKEGLCRDTHFIASTGIAGISADPKRSVEFNAMADTKIGKSQIRQIYGKSHLNPTYEYGVSFERGTSVDYGDRRHVYISGTASIDNKGQIVAPGDVKAQTMRMLENITVLLAEADCRWEDVAYMTVYLRDIADYKSVRAIIDGRFLGIPRAMVLAPVCRPGWLVETECMAIKKTDNRAYAPY